MGFAAAGFFLYALSTQGDGSTQFLCLILAAATLQARLVCNLIDGMVAIEGGKGAKDSRSERGARPRLRSPLPHSTGLAAQQPTLGLLAASLAIATAYIRELGRAEGFPPTSPPLAKPQRMAVLTAGTVLAAFYASEWTLSVTLWIIVAGTAITILRRSLTLIGKLKAR